MLLRKGFHQVKVKYGSNRLTKVGVEDGSNFASSFQFFGEFSYYYYCYSFFLLFLLSVEVSTPRNHLLGAYYAVEKDGEFARLLLRLYNFFYAF